MANEVVWTLSKYELICEQGMLNDDDRRKLKMHIQDASNQEIATEYHCDVSRINEDINRYKVIYDELQKEFPSILDPRSKDIYRKRRKEKHKY